MRVSNEVTSLEALVIGWVSTMKRSQVEKLLQSEIFDETQSQIFMAILKKVEGVIEAATIVPESTD